MPEVPQYILKLNKSDQLQKAINEALYILSKLGVPLEGMSQRRYEDIDTWDRKPGEILHFIQP